MPPLPGPHARAFGPGHRAKLSRWNAAALAWHQATGLWPAHARAVDDVVTKIGIYQMLADPALGTGVPAAIRPRLCQDQRAAVVAAVVALGRAGATIWWRTVDNGRLKLFFVPVRPAR